MSRARARREAGSFCGQQVTGYNHTVNGVDLMLMVPSTGLWAKLWSDEEGFRFYPIVAVVVTTVRETHFRGIMAIGKEMYEADKDEQFKGYATQAEYEEWLAHEKEYPRVTDRQVSS